MPELYPGRVRSPNFPPGLHWVNSPPLAIADLRGKLVVLDFWTTCCINCIHILPHMHRLAEELGPEVVVIGVHSPKFPAETDPALLEQSVRLNHVTHAVVNDHDMDIWQQFGVNAWPTLIFIDPAGYVFARHAGEFEYEPMRNAVAALVTQFRQPKLISDNPLPTLPTATPTPGPLAFPGKLLAHPESDRLFVADSGHNQIVVATLDGHILDRIGTGEPGFTDGRATSAEFQNPQGLALDPTGNTLYVADPGNHALRAIDLATGDVVTLAGTGKRRADDTPGPGRDIALASPWDLVWHDDRLWIAMAGMHQIWTCDPATGIVAPAAGTGAESIHDGPLAEATFAQPMGITSDGAVLYVADSESSAVRRIDPRNDRVRRLIGRGLFHFGDLDARGDSVRLQHVQAVAALGDAVYLADTYNNKVKRLDPLTRAVTTIAGSGEPELLDGPAEDAAFSLPSGLAATPLAIYIADTNNHAIRRLDLTTLQVETLIPISP